MKKVVLLILVSAATLVVASTVAASSTLTPDQFKTLVMKERTGPTTAQGTVAYSTPSWVPAGAPVTTPDTPAQICWSVDGMDSEWGTWPYQQRVSESRYWCATNIGGYQNYRVSHVFLHSAACDTSGAYGYLVGGGNGYTWSTVRSGGHFHCQTPTPWLAFNSDAWQEWACNTWGNCAFVRSHRDT